MPRHDPALWAQVPAFNSMRASGDGRLAFFTCGGETEVDNLWVVPMDGSAPARRLTDETDHVTIRDVAEDGAAVVLAQSVHANEHDHLMLWTGQGLRRLTPVQDAHYLYGGTLTSDGKALIFIADYDYDSGKVTQGGWVWRQDLATGARTCLARSDTPFERGLALSPDGKSLLWHRHETRPGASQLWVMGVDGSNLREVLRVSDGAAARGRWIDAGRIAVVSDVDGQDRFGILTLGQAVDWLGAEPEVLAHDVVAGHGDFALIHHADSRTLASRWTGAGLEALPNRTGRASLLPHDPTPEGWLCEAYDAGAPHEIVHVTRDGAVTRLFAPRAPAGSTFTRPRDFRWTATDGRPVQGWLYEPAAPSQGFIAYVHGGPTWHSEDWVNVKVQAWVQAGFTVLDPNYRGSTGFGHDWREAVKEDGWGGREQLDIRTGVEAAVRQGLATPGRIGIAGNSYGGFSSWTGITRHADLYAAAIPMCGMYRLDIDYHETEMPHGRAYSEEMMGGTPEDVPEKYEAGSPGRFIHDIRGRLLIVHGMADSNVGPANSTIAARELTEAGIPHEVMFLDDEGHGVFRRSNVETYLRRSVDFFRAAFEGR